MPKNKPIQATEKVFDTRGIEASLTQNSITQSFDNAEDNTTQPQQSTDLDNNADAVINLNGIPVSPSTGTTRTALMMKDKQSNTIQIDEDLRFSTYR